jgi:hypothetical protein
VDSRAINAFHKRVGRFRFAVSDVHDVFQRITDLLHRVEPRQRNANQQKQNGGKTKSQLVSY